MRRSKDPISRLERVGLRNVVSQETKAANEILVSALVEGAWDDVAAVVPRGQLAIFAVAVAVAVVLIVVVASELRARLATTRPHRTPFEVVVGIVVGLVEVLAAVELARHMETRVDEMSTAGSDTWALEPSSVAVVEREDFPQEIAMGPFERDI